METKLSRIIGNLKVDMGLYFGSGLGVFLFVLFFQPFHFQQFDFNNRLLFTAGIGTICFLVMMLVCKLFPRFNRQGEGDHQSQSYLQAIVILLLSSVAIAFYLRYVGNIQLTFYIMLKVVLISFAPPLILRITRNTKILKLHNQALLSEKQELVKKLDQYRKDKLNVEINFMSESGTENLKLEQSDIVFINSADNYVAIQYWEGDRLKSKLLRNTLTNLEVQLKAYPNFIRCHRSYIVNRQHIEKLNKSPQKYSLSLLGYEEEIPVSRQYLLGIKEAL